MHHPGNTINLPIPTIAILLFCLLWSCSNNNLPSDTFSMYTLKIEETGKKSAPALQSFVHGIHGDEWLLFAGRTNKTGSYDGGLHNINGNYADSSFIPFSFNSTIYVYNVSKDTADSLAVGDLINFLTTNWPGLDKYLDRLYRTFVSSNPQVTQDDAGFLYVIGGYGPIGIKDTSNYITYNQIAKIHIPTMISIVKNTYGNIKDLQIPIRLGQHDKLVSTGGEVFILDDKFYLAGGHNFGGGINNYQQYVSAVYPFTIEDKPVFDLDITVDNPITDAVNPSDSAEANNSAFRRRDAPIVPSIYYNKSSAILEQGLTFYGGVFQPGFPTRAWNNAIYVKPGDKNDLYYYDSDYSQDNHNVYSCPDFVGYDSSNKLLHTFLLGGIGSGIGHGGDTLSGFTNNSLHITNNVDSLSSRYELIENSFKSDTLFGAEAAMILNDNLKFFVTNNKDTSEVIDISAVFAGNPASVEIGYVYGGIEAYNPNPRTFGKDKSAATNKIWNVLLVKNPN